jgi:hypothetical protein
MGVCDKNEDIGSVQDPLFFMKRSSLGGGIFDAVVDLRRTQ